MDTRGGGGSVTTVEERWDAGDLEALRAQYEPLRRFAAVIGRWDVEPDDLVQEAYAKVLAKQPSQIRDLGPYLRRMVVNLATDERRRFGPGGERRRRRSRPTARRSDSYPSDLSDLLALAAAGAGVAVHGRGRRSADRAGRRSGRDVERQRARRVAARPPASARRAEQGVVR